MPYKVVKNHPSCPKSKPYAVVKKSDNKKIGCHPTRESANKQIAAIEANESKHSIEAIRDRLFADPPD